MHIKDKVVPAAFLDQKNDTSASFIKKMVKVYINVNNLTSKS